ncbi:MAG: hypothetical protein A4E49_00702 [Methanosaeta sp. PtaU1.Bin112]|nr:MAG: hypothetical protein A4E49_00702 [Methanosaeta sp. PtaU1.Bin112]
MIDRKKTTEDFTEALGEEVDPGLLESGILSNERRITLEHIFQ